MIHINIRLDTRKQLKNKSFPIALQITWTENKANKMRRKRFKGLSCKMEAWDQFEHRFLYSERKNEIIRQQLAKAEMIVADMEEWDYKSFVRLFDKVNEEKEVTHKKLIAYTRELEEYYKKKGQIGYSENFKGIASFLDKVFVRDIRTVDFRKKQLDKVLALLDERQINGYSYMKFLKIVMSESIKNGYSKAADCPIQTKYSPTGYDINKRKGKPSKNVKKNRIKDLLSDEKDKVVDFYYKGKIPETQRKHLAYWVLAYKLFGVNFKDLALIKWSDINNGIWDYSRSKTGVKSDTGKPVNAEAMAILKEYDSGGKYILDVLNGWDTTPAMIQKRLHNFKANMRRTFKLLSEKLFDDGRYITWYSVRYTAPTIALENGVDLKTVMTLMDHASIKTTSRYIGRVRDRKKLAEAVAVL